MGPIEKYSRRKEDTADRLLATGNTAAMAKEKIAVAVVGQIYDAMRDGKAFDLEKYTEELNLLH